MLAVKMQGPYHDETLVRQAGPLLDPVAVALRQQGLLQPGLQLGRRHLLLQQADEGGLVPALPGRHHGGEPLLEFGQLIQGALQHQGLVVTDAREVAELLQQGLQPDDGLAAVTRPLRKVLIHPVIAAITCALQSGLGQGDGRKPGAQRGQHALVEAVLAGGDQGAPVEILRQVILEGLAVHQPRDGAHLLPLGLADAGHVDLHHQGPALLPGPLHGIRQGVEGGLARMDGPQQPVLLLALGDAVEGRIREGVQRQQQAEQEGEQRGMESHEAPYVSGMSAL